MTIEENILLSSLVTFRVGGIARYFVRVKSIDELREAVEFSKNNNLRFFVLGEGSNTLARDEGFEGVIIKNEIKGIKIKEEDGEFLIECGAGENWDSLVSFSISQKLYGLENLSYIPGSVGAAPVQNIGAYGVEVKEYIDKVEIFDAESMEVKQLSNKACKFSYRDSVFKQKEGKSFIITKVIFKLSKKGKVNIGYKDLRECFKERYSSDVTPIEIREVVINIRKNKLPDSTKVATAGSFFKNPFISKSHFEKLKKEYPHIPGFEENKKIKVPLAWILDNICHLRGTSQGNVGLYQNQPLAVVNLGNATFLEIKSFTDSIRDLIKEKTGIVVEWEVRVVDEEKL